jgi:hypothetical protein
MRSLVIATGLALALASPAFAQQDAKGATVYNPVAPKPAAKPPENYKAPRTSWGAPDFQGLWTNATLTSPERPAQYQGRAVMTPEEAFAIEHKEASELVAWNKPTDPNARTQDLEKDCGRGFVGVSCGYNHFWTDPGTRVMQINGEYRTSMVVEPANGRVPATTPAAAQRRNARAAQRPKGAGPYDDPEARGAAERCLTSFGSSAGPPMLPLLYNNTYQIVQSPTHAMILVEMVHDARIVPLTRDRKRPDAVKQWMGDSIGWYEGDTLVVETTNFRPDNVYRGGAPASKVTERFRRESDDKIVYSFEINDPETYAAPWKGEVAMNATPGPLYEYACHEGNYALPGILSGGQAVDARNASGKPQAAHDEGE